MTLRRNVWCDGSLNPQLLETFLSTFLRCNGSPQLFSSYCYGKQSLMNCILSIPPSAQKLSTIDCLTEYMVEYQSVFHLCASENREVLQTLQSYVYELRPFGDEALLQRIQDRLNRMCLLCVCCQPNWETVGPSYPMKSHRNGFQIRSPNQFE